MEGLKIELLNPFGPVHAYVLPPDALSVIGFPMQTFALPEICAVTEITVMEIVVLSKQLPFDTTTE